MHRKVARMLLPRAAVYILQELATAYKLMRWRGFRAYNAYAVHRELENCLWADQCRHGLQALGL